MDTDALRQAVEHAGLAATGVAFLAGFLFSFNPVALASIPVSLAYVTKARDKDQAILFGAMFFSLAWSSRMSSWASLRAWADSGLRRSAGGVGACFLVPLLIVLGLIWTGWLRIPLPSFGFRATRPTAAWGAFLLGIPFAIAVCPVCTPALVVLLGVAAGSASVFLGATLLLAFALGRAVPIAIGAIGMGWLENLKGISRYRRGFEIAGGLTLIVMGVYMLNAVYFWVPDLAL